MIWVALILIFARCLLLERGFNASRVDLPHSTYDIVVEQSQDGTIDMIRVQVKTVGKQGAISFKGGVRGGQDREYKSGVKEYIQSTKTSDVVVGVKSVRANGDEKIDFYFIPTLYIEHIKQGSLSINKIPKAKNNWAILLNCKNINYVQSLFEMSD